MLNIEIIENKGELSATGLRRRALEIIEAGIRRVLPDAVMRSALSFDKSESILKIDGHVHTLTGRLFVIGGGKASGAMAQALEEITGTDAITAGMVIDKASPGEYKTGKIHIAQAGHPLPDSRGVAAVREILGLKQKYAIGGEDVVLCLLSGGASALMPCPAAGISLEDKQKVTSLLLSCGADISEINAVRKHLSGTKGGRLAQHFAPARVISLILSDVIGNDLGVIASGPTCPDSSTFDDAYSVLKKYHLSDKTPTAVLLRLEQGCRGEIEETPDKLDNVQNYIIGDIRLALDAMADTATDCGLKPIIITASQSGDTAAVARQRAAEILSGRYAGYNALLIGGETTPALPASHGQGGRNQHYAALTAVLLEAYPGDRVCASVGSDGSDFMPDVAGAIVDRQTLDVFKSRIPGYPAMLEHYDSYTLLKTTGNSLVVTGATGTNVGDIILYLI